MGWTVADCEDLFCYVVILQIVWIVVKLLVGKNLQRIPGPSDTAGGCIVCREARATVGDVCCGRP